MDVIYTADPRIEPKARKIDAISYDAMLDMASLGAQVIHTRAVQFGKKYDVEIHVRSSFTDNPGTLITHEVEQMEEFVVSGVTVQKDLSQFVMVGLPDRPGVAADIFGRIAERNVIVDNIIQTVNSDGTANTSFIVLGRDLAECELVMKEIEKAYNLKEVICKDPIAKVSVVGVGMRSHYGVAATMFKALAEAQINISEITTSEIKISCIIDPAVADEAVRAVHAAFELEEDEKKLQITNFK